MAKEDIDIEKQSEAVGEALKAREEEIRADIVVAPCGNRDCAVVSLSGGTRRIECKEGMAVPMVIYSDLESREAAEVARGEVLGQAINDCHVYGPSEVPLSHFNAVGRVLLELRSSGTMGDWVSFANRAAGL